MNNQIIQANTDQLCSLQRTLKANTEEMNDLKASVDSLRMVIRELIDLKAGE